MIDEEFELDEVAAAIVQAVVNERLDRWSATGVRGDTPQVLEKIFTALHFAGCQSYIDALIFGKSNHAQRGSLSYAIDVINFDDHFCDQIYAALVQFFCFRKKA